MGFVVINSKGFRHRRDRRPHTQRHRTQPPNIARMVGSQNIRIRECSTSEPNRPDTSRKMNRINFGHDRGSPPNSLARRGEAAGMGETIQLRRHRPNHTQIHTAAVSRKTVPDISTAALMMGQARRDGLHGARQQRLDCTPNRNPPGRRHDLG